MDPVSSEGLEPTRVSRRDLIAFVTAFVVGLAAYVALHAVLKAHQLVVTTAVVLVMVAYAVFVARAKSIRVRLDQAGDNAYYLGLLFTLTSMGFALYEFGVSTEAGGSGVYQIISNFGIALASTIFGIFLRIFLHQMRVDPADVESMTRLELSDAAKRVRASLDTLYGDLGRFHDEVRQRTGDVVNQLLKDSASAMSSLTGELANTTKGMLETTEASQQEVLRRTTELTRMLEEGATAASGAAERLRAIEPPPLVFTRRLQKLTSVMETLTTNLEAATKNFAGVDTSAAGAIARLSESTQVLARLTKELERSQNASGQQLAATVKAVGEALTTVGTGLERDRQLLDDVANSARTSTSEAARAQAAASEVLSRLTEMTVALAESVKRAS